MQSTQKGFGTVEIITVIAVIILVGLLGWIGYTRWSESNNSSSETTQQNQTNNGELVITSPDDLEEIITSLDAINLDENLNSLSELDTEINKF